MRYRITFSKTSAMRYTSHLDLFRTWERTFRRAGLPLAYSQGFHPHPRLNLASALPLGFTSDEEVLDVWLEKEITPEQVQAALAPAAPPGVQIARIEAIEERQPALQVQLAAAEFTITFLDPIPDLEQRLAALLAAVSLPRQRRGKDYDLRPLILHAERLPDDDKGRPRLQVRLSAREGATGRPEELILALGGEPEQARVHRTRLVFGDL
jgi:radical SAM-linked protein